MRLRTIALAALLAVGASSSAFGQCSGNPPAGRICGNGTAAAGLPSWYTMSIMLDRNFGAPSAQGTMLNRGASLWSATATPSLGLNGTAGGSIALQGATSGSVTIGAKAAAGTGTIFNLPITNGSLNNVLVTDGSGNTSWASAGSGTVSSVGLALPASILTVSGSPVTTTGTLTGTLATQSANLVWAGPTTGAAATPTFRSLVGADLPNPTSGTLGGVESLAAVTSNWIRAISTSGVPSASQPAFTDISGSVAAAQLPNPTASTLGGIESYVAVAHQWINTISTSGVPSSTQPAFTDISGQTTLAQLPSIGSNSILSNITGGTTTPLANSLTAIIDSAIDNTQGDILYRSGTVWTALNPGTSGQVLTTAGASANPSWTTVTGTGTVTSVATNNGITGGTITTTGTIGLATIATGNVLANTSGGSAVPTANTPTKVLDVIGATEGDVLYRGASVWTALAPGTNGQFLQTTGAGSTPQWASAVASLNGQTGVQTFGMQPQGRLTLTTGTPVTTTDVTGATTVYYTPFIGTQVPIYDGSTYMVPTTFAELSQATTDTTKSPAAVANNSVYDVFAWNDSGTIRATRGPAWTSDTSRGTGAGTSQIQQIQGIWTNENSITNGPAANRGTLVGSIRSNGSAQIVDSKVFRWTSNLPNVCVQRQMAVIESTASWTYTTGTFRQANANAADQLDMLQTLAGQELIADVFGAYANTNASTFGIVGIDIDTLNTTTIVSNLNNLQYVQVANALVSASAKYNGYPGLGRHIAIWKEYSVATGTGTFFGNAGGAVLQSGIYGNICN